MLTLARLAIDQFVKCCVMRYFLVFRVVLSRFNFLALKYIEHDSQVETGLKKPEIFYNTTSIQQQQVIHFIVQIMFLFVFQMYELNLIN